METHIGICLFSFVCKSNSQCSLFNHKKQESFKGELMKPSTTLVVFMNFALVA